jgi:hypothetical protein
MGRFHGPGCDVLRRSYLVYAWAWPKAHRILLELDDIHG